MPAIGLDDLRRYAVGRSLFMPTTLRRGIERLGFVQADPIRAPARAQDLILRHRVKNYRAGDLERSFARAGVEEDFFVNHGFLPRATYLLMHPRVVRRTRTAVVRRRALEVLAFVRERGSVHPREVDAHFQHGTVENYWGGASSATTHALGDLHYRGLLRVEGRESGVRVYAPADVPAAEKLDARTRRDRVDALIDVVVGTYAPLPHTTLAPLIGRLRFAAPQWRSDLKEGIARARQRLAQAKVEGVTWYWPAGERPLSRKYAEQERVRLFTPFDPVVWDRKRFELLWGWAFRFEAYLAAAQRVRGYYALPLLWRDRVIGWGNLTFNEGELQSSFGFAGPRPREAAFDRELAAELARIRAFLERRE